LQSLPDRPILSVTAKEFSSVTKKTDWTGKAAMAGAAIGSAALAAALLYASRRKERAEKTEPKAPPVDVPETD
jgi:Na+/H+-translocating membrane pyrophosphatase